MAKTKTFTVDNAGSPEPIQVVTKCRLVTIYEDAQAGTTDWKYRAPSAADTPVTKPAGSKKEFEARGFFAPGDIIGYAETVAGSVSFAQEED